MGNKTCSPFVGRARQNTSQADDFIDSNYFYFYHLLPRALVCHGCVCCYYECKYVGVCAGAYILHPSSGQPASSPTSALVHFFNRITAITMCEYLIHTQNMHVVCDGEFTFLTCKFAKNSRCYHIYTRCCCWAPLLYLFNKFGLGILIYLLSKFYLTPQLRMEVNL
jgi:hypothetical protein